MIWGGGAERLVLGVWVRGGFEKSMRSRGGRNI